MKSERPIFFQLFTVLVVTSTSGYALSYQINPGGTTYHGKVFDAQQQSYHSPVIPDDNGFTATFPGATQPRGGDVLKLEVAPGTVDGESCKISGRVNASTPEGGWMGGRANLAASSITFTASIPLSFSGVHNGNFGGNYACGNGGAGVPPTWDGLAKADIQGLGKVTFIENSGQAFGFDDFTDPKLPWKSIAASASDVVDATISAEVVPNTVFFQEDDPRQVIEEIDPTQATQQLQTLTIDAVLLAPMFTGAAGRVKANLDAVDGTNAANLNVLVLERDRRKLIIQPIVEDNDDVQTMNVGNMGERGRFSVCVTPGPNKLLDTNPQGDDEVLGETITAGDNEICDTVANDQDVVANVYIYSADEYKSDLNDVFRQAVIQFDEVERKDPIEINYDRNRDGELDSEPGNREEEFILAGSPQFGKDTLVVYIVPTVGQVDGVEAGGYADSLRRAAYAVENPDIVAHEVGHLLGLGHVDDDPQNLMLRAPTGQRLRKSQWADANHRPTSSLQP